MPVRWFRVLTITGTRKLNALRQFLGLLIETGFSLHGVHVPKTVDVDYPEDLKKAVAVEATIRLAKSYTGKFEVISFWGGFHGKTGGGLSNWRKIVEIAGGGILLDHDWHHLYLVLSIIRDVPLSASAKMQYLGGSHLEDEVDLSARFKNDEAHLHLTWRSSQRQNFGKIKGENGMISINDDHLILHKNGLPPIRYDFPYPLSRSSHHLEWMKPVIEDFRREILDINVRGANFIEAKWCAHLISLAYRSQREDSRFIKVGSIPQYV